MDLAKKTQWEVFEISDLARHPKLPLGFSSEFMDRGDGWPGLRSAYGFEHERVRGLDHDIAYRALVSGELDVMRTLC